MGMGEPLLNTDNVVAAIRCLNQDVGISQRAMTLSTVGIPGRIRKLADEQLQVTLAVSLHASNQPQRIRLIPSAKSFTPLAVCWRNAGSTSSSPGGESALNTFCWRG